jgi:ribosomal protein S18 acetylase RimI-like enzyme
MTGTSDMQPYVNDPLCPAYPLAVDRSFQGRGLGEALLMNALHRTLHTDVATFTLLVDAKNDQAVAFYQRYGFRPLQSQPRTLFLPLATAQRAFPKRPVY